MSGLRFWRPPRRALRLFLGLDALPGALDVRRSHVAVLVGEDMRVTADHFARDGLDHIAERERVLLLRHAGVKHHLQQEVAEFVAQVVEIAACDRVDNLIGLLDRIGRDAREILFEVPRTAGHGGPKPGHDLDQAGNVAGRGHGGVQVTRDGQALCLKRRAYPSVRQQISTGWPRRAGMLMAPP